MSLQARLALRRGTLALDVELEASAGERLAVVGPNGAGKTTLLRALGGLLRPERGRVVLDGEVLDDPQGGLHVPPERRPIGVVFQDHLLFPHLSAAENVAFGLRAAGVGRRQALRQAVEWLERVGLADRRRDRPDALSGGQAQRVALARALATQPRVLLLDEPFAATDAARRTEVRHQLEQHLAAYEGIQLLVTHDPLQAAAATDRLAVLEEGVITQAGTVADLTARPRSAWAAQLVGVNLLRGEASGDTVLVERGGQLVVAGRHRGPVFARVHPHALVVHRRRPEGSARNVWAGTVVGIDAVDDRVRVTVATTPQLVAEVTPQAAAELGLAAGVEVWVSLKATEVEVYPA